MVYGYRPSHTPTTPGRSSVGFPPTKQIILTPSVKRREVLCESHEGERRLPILLSFAAAGGGGATAGELSVRFGFDETVYRENHERSRVDADAA